MRTPEVDSAKSALRNAHLLRIARRQAGMARTDVFDTHSPTDADELGRIRAEGVEVVLA
jgi:hypothetical protein